jgi:RNA polymerase sigma factor (TIGR02999 family)
MDAAETAEITNLLLSWNAGDERALEKLMPVVYTELHKIARKYMSSETPGHTLQPSALLNEAYLQLIDCNRVAWQGRTHFYAVCAQIMRRILVDFARRRGGQKRGGGNRPVSLESAGAIPMDRSQDLVALDDALQDLAAMDERKARIVEMRFFGGLTFDETAEALGISVTTVNREWAKARAWLYRQLLRGGDDAGEMETARPPVG